MVEAISSIELNVHEKTLEMFKSRKRFFGGAEEMRYYRRGSVDTCLKKLKNKQIFPLLVDFSSFSQYYQGIIDFNNLGMHSLIYTDGKGSDN